MAQRGLKNIHATLRAAGFGALLESDDRWASRPGNLRIVSAVPLAQRGLKNIPATLRAAGFGTPLGATFVWPQGRAGCGLRPQNLGRKGAKNDHATLRAARFGASLGATVVWPQNQAICGLRPRHLGPKGSKKHSCNPVGCGIWHVLEGYGRLVSRPDKLRAAPATAKPKEAHSEADR